MCIYTQFIAFIHVKNEPRWNLSTSVEQKIKKNGRKKRTVWRETGDSIVRAYNKYYSVARGRKLYT